ISLHAADRRLGRAHLHHASSRDRPRLPHAGARRPAERSDRGRGGVHDHGGCGSRGPGAHVWALAGSVSQARDSPPLVPAKAGTQEPKWAKRSENRRDCSAFAPSRKTPEKIPPNSTTPSHGPSPPRLDTPAPRAAPPPAPPRSRPTARPPARR